MKRLFLLLAIFLMATTFAFAQRKKGNTKKPFQMSILTPLGTNTTDSHLITNIVSINLLGGYSMGNVGFELGGLYNINTQLTRGFQMAGLTNISGLGKSSFQVAGIANINSEQYRGVQIGGAFNIVSEGMIDVQIGGLGNYAHTASVQIGGLINRARRVNTLQIGLVNYSESNNGTCIGLINIIRSGGKYEFEVGAGDALNMNLSFRYGTNKMYTILSAGVNVSNKDAEYAVGGGFGTDFKLDKKKKINGQVEIMSYNISEKGKFRFKDVNLLNQLKLTASKEIAPHLKLYGGPTLNIAVTKKDRLENGQKMASFIPYSLFQGSRTDKYLVDGWIGVSAGMRF